MMNHSFEIALSIAPGIANHLWQSTIFAALIALLILWLRNYEPRIHYNLWLAASLKFLLPFSLLTTLARHMPQSILLRELRGDLSHTAQAIGEPFTFFVTTMPTQTTHASNFALFLAATWICGTVAFLVVWLSRWRSAAALVRTASPASEGREVDALRRAMQSSGLTHRVPLVFTSRPTEPGLFGIVHPVILWPSPLSNHLTDMHMEAIFTHELSHLRRRDNLAAAMHTLVQALFWFHPLVWWLGSELAVARENACDQEVLQCVRAPQLYAESILRTCEFCVSASLACISGVTGADLKQRILRVMANGTPVKLCPSRQLLLVFALVAAVGTPVIFDLMYEPAVSAANLRPQAARTPTALNVALQASGVDESSTKDAEANQHIYQVGGDVSAPKLIFAPDPQFSEEALRKKYQGVCVLALVVDTQGKPQKVIVERHLGMGLDQKAVEAVRLYKFSPATLHGKPVPVKVHIEVNFRRY